MDIRGKKVVLTGTFHQIGRKEAEDRLEALGAKCVGAISKNVDVLFAGEKAGSKVEKAKALGIEVLGEDDLFRILGHGGESAQESEVDDVAFDGSNTPENLVAAIESVGWGSASSETIAALSDALKMHEKIHGITAAHKAATRRLMAAKRAVLMNNMPHTARLTGHSLSHDKLRFVTGSECGSDYNAGGQLAIWDVPGGRLINVIDRIVGGVGSSDYNTQITWSPDDRLIGFDAETSYNACVKPDESVSGAYAKDCCGDGWDRVPTWCWAPDSKRHFVFCLESDDTDRLPGCISTPQPQNTPQKERIKRQYMAKLDDEFDYDGGDLQDNGFSCPVWRADDIVVGLGEGEEGEIAYAIDLNTRQICWQRDDISEISANLDGSQIIYNNDGGFITYLDGATGKDALETNIPAMTRHVWATDNKRFAGQTLQDESVVNVVHSSELLAELKADKPIFPIGFSPDGTQLAVHNYLDRQVQIWKVGPETTLLSTVELSNTGYWNLYYGAENTLIIITNTQDLCFFDALTGEVRASHALFSFPGEEPLSVALKVDDIGTFPLAETWGYFIDNIIIGEGLTEEQFLDSKLQLAVDRRHAWPLAWVETRQYADFYAAVEAHPKAFPQAILNAFKKAAASKKQKTKGSRLPFPIENEHTLDDLLAATQQWLQEGILSSLDQTCEIAIQLILWGRANEVDAFIGNFEDTRTFTNSGGEQEHLLAQDRRGVIGIAQVAAYLSRTDQKELAARYVQSMEKLLELMPTCHPVDSQISYSYRHAVARAWLAAAKLELTGTDDGYFDQVWEEYKKVAVQDGWQGYICRNIATAYAFSGQYDRALEMLIDHGSYFHFAEIKEFLDFLAEAKDLDKIERILKWFYEKEECEDEDITNWMINACAMSGKPERAYDLLPLVRGSNSASQWKAIGRNIAAVESFDAARTYLESRYNELHDKDYAGNILAAWAEYDSQAASSIVTEELANLPSDNGDRRSNLKRLAPAIFYTQAPEVALGFFTYHHRPKDELLTFLEMLPPDTPFYEKLIEEGAERIKNDWNAMNDHSKARSLVGGFFGVTAMPRLLKILRFFPELSKPIADNMLKVVVNDEKALLGLAYDFAAAGDLARANTARMRLVPALREYGTRRLFQGAIASGHFSAALVMLNQMETRPNQTSIREEEATKALVEVIGDGAWRTIMA